MSPAADPVEHLYELAKAGRWTTLLASLLGEADLAARCSRYRRPSSGWTFLHQAAYGGEQDVARALIRLGASTTCSSRDGETPADVAIKNGHGDLARLLQAAARDADGLWAAPADAALLPSSRAWAETVERRATRERKVAYGGGVVLIRAGARHFVDSFERTLVGWHGTFDPPCGMDGEPVIDVDRAE